MSTQSEAALENKLLEQLFSQGYERVCIKDENELQMNFKKQLERHNKVMLTDREFEKVFLIILQKDIYLK